MDIHYPFIPKSNRYLTPGQFWPIQLSNGHFGCGIVLDVPDRNKHDKRMFYAGLLNWTSIKRPTETDLENSTLIILGHGKANIKTIISQTECIIGVIDIVKNGLFLNQVVDSAQYSPSSMVLRGFQTLGKATLQDHEQLATISTWGYNFINILADKLLTA